MKDNVWARVCGLGSITYMHDNYTWPNERFHFIWCIQLDKPVDKLAESGLEMRGT